MELICFGILFLLGIIYSIDYYAFWYFLSKKYPEVLSWLKGGGFLKKGEFIGFNAQRDLSLMFQESYKFREKFKNADFISQYDLLLEDKRFKFRKGFLSVYFFVSGVIFLTLIYYIIWGSYTGSIKSK